ncbi:MAG: PaaI family thioesterase, partial [Terriglobia bacterium]
RSQKMGNVGRLPITAPAVATSAPRDGAGARIGREIQRRSQARRPKNSCFGCGKDNPEGMKLQFLIDDANRLVRGSFRLPARYEGPPAHAHGGIIAVLMDEAMGKLNRPENIVALTAEMTVEYLRPVPLRKKITVEARPTDHNGRNYWRECSIRDAHGTLLARGKGRFVKVADRIAPR